MLKTLKGLGLVSLALLLFTCKKDTIAPIDQSGFETAEIESIRSLFERDVTYLSKTINDSITITPDWDTLGQEELVFTDALLTHIQATIDVPLGSFEHRLIFLGYNGLLYRAIEVYDVESYNTDGSIRDGRAYYFLFNGNYFDGYIVEDSHLTKRLVLQESSAKSANMSMMKTGEGTDNVRTA